MTTLIKSSPLSIVAAIVSALAGVAGTVLVPLYGSSLSTAVSAVLQSVAGLLVVIAGYHVTVVASYAARLNIAKKVGQ